jgi:hypothetical protein
MPFGRSRVVFVMDRSVLKTLQTWGRSSLGFMKSPDLGAAQRSGYPCAHFENPMRFLGLTPTLRRPSLWLARAKSKNDQKVGFPGRAYAAIYFGGSATEAAHAKMPHDQHIKGSNGLADSLVRQTECYC